MNGEYKSDARRTENYLYMWQCLVKMWVCSYPRIDFFLQTNWIRGILSWVFKFSIGPIWVTSKIWIPCCCWTMDFRSPHLSLIATWRLDQNFIFHKRCSLGHHLPHASCTYLLMLGPFLRICEREELGFLTQSSILSDLNTFKLGLPKHKKIK